MRRSALLLSFAVFAAACSGDKAVTGPDDPSCVKAQITPGGTKTGRLGATSCTFTDSIWLDDSSHYDSYTFQAAAGRAYLLTARAPDAYTDYVLELMGSGATAGQETLLSVADDEGGNYDPQMLFVAPQSGVYSLRVLGYSYSDTNTYTLTARECPVRATITTSFSDAGQQLQGTDCVWGYTAFSSGDSSHVAVYSVHFDAGTSRQITVVSTGFTPGFFIGGPGFDSYCHLGACRSGALGWGSSADSLSGTFAANNSGDYTLVVGASSGYSATGTFKLTVGPSQPVVRRTSALLAPPTFLVGRKMKVRAR